MKNLQALEQLEKSAQEQEKRLSNTIQEIHSENLKDLMQSLKATHKQKSENIDKSIQQLEKELKTKTEKLSESLTEIHKNKLRNIEEMIREKLEQENNLKAILTGVVTFIITVALTIGGVMLISNKQYNKDGSITYHITKR